MRKPISYWATVAFFGAISLLANSSFVFSQDATSAPQAPPATIKPKSHLIRAIRRFSYVCAGDNKVAVSLRGSYARVSFKDHSYSMKQVESASGTKYSDGSVIWWSKGEEGFLQESNKFGTDEFLAKECHLKSGDPTTITIAPPAANTVTGTVSYLQRMAMPPDAVVHVQLLDVSLADAPSKVIAEDKITFGQRQVPIPFELKFDPAKIDPKHRYSVSARILTGDELRFISDKSYSVLTQNHPSKVDLILVQVVPSPASKP